MSKTLIMGVMNVTPNSFYGPSRVQAVDTAVERAAAMVSEGADILDVGGESSRPGAEPIGLDEELARVTPVLEALRGRGYRISVDTVRAETAREAIRLGATMINDISALRGDPEMAGVVADAGVECVLMHMQGTPQTMQDAPHYEDVVEDICRFFEERLEFARKSGISENKVWLDPGFGFGKTVRHNLMVLRRLDEFKRFGRPVLVGTSNKSTIGRVLNVPLEDRLEGTAATVAIAILKGADAVRVHDVRAMARVARMCDAVAGRIHVD